MFNGSGSVLSLLTVPSSKLVTAFVQRLKEFVSSPVLRGWDGVSGLADGAEVSAKPASPSAEGAAPSSASSSSLSSLPGRPGKTHAV